MKSTLVVATVTAALTVVLPAAATTPPAPTPTTHVAQRDVAGDLHSYHAMPVDGGNTPEVAAPNRKNGDIVGTRVNHTRTNVRVLLRFRELAPGGEQQIYWFRFVTPKTVRNVGFASFAGKQGPIDRVAYWTGTKPRMTGPHGNARRCVGMTKKIDYRANTALLVVPRTCLGNPASVEVGARWEIRTNYQVGFYDGAWYAGGDYRYPPVPGPRVYNPVSVKNARR